MVIDLIKKIDAGMHREFKADGSLKEATFELSNGIYHIGSDFRLRKEDNTPRGSSYVPLHFCKGGIYPEYTIVGMPVKAYVLSMIAQDVEALQKYQSGLVINHCVVVRIPPRTLNIGSNNFYEKEVVIKTAPKRELSYNPAYLEFVTHSENVRHGKFIQRFSLYDTYVSAKDIDELRKRLVPYDPAFFDTQEAWVTWNRLQVEKFYGEGKQILF